MWTRENTLALISLYEKYPQLYNVSNPAYKNKTKRRLCLKQISEELNLTCNMQTTTDIISKKVNGLRTTFSQEINKIKKSRASGAGTDEIYEPTWWCFEAMLFLTNYNIINEGESNLNIEKLESNLTQENISENTMPESEIWSSDNTEILFEDINPESSSPSLLQMTYPKSTSDKIQHKQQEKLEVPRKRKKTGEENDFFKNVNEVLTNMNAKEVETDHDHLNRFVKHIEAEMRLIQDNNKVQKLKASISKLIYEAQEE